MVVFWTFIFKVIIIAVLFGFIIGFTQIAGWIGKRLTEYLFENSSLSDKALQLIYWGTVVIAFSFQYAVFHTIIEALNK